MARRDFLKRTAVGLTAAGTSLTTKVNLANTAPVGSHPFEPKQTFYNCELLVVGGSSAGTAAALTAGRSGDRKKRFISLAPLRGTPF